MSKQSTQSTFQPGSDIKTLAIILGTAFLLTAPLQAAEHTRPATRPATVQPTAPAAAPVTTAGPIEFASQVNATVGKSTLLRLPAPATRVSIGSPDIADVILLNPREIYMLGKRSGPPT